MDATDFEDRISRIGTAWTVVLEAHAGEGEELARAQVRVLDLSEQQQFLDVVILRRGRGRLIIRLPDGLEGLAAHNLLTFKSYREAPDAWAMKELIGH